MCSPWLTLLIDQGFQDTQTSVFLRKILKKTNGLVLAEFFLIEPFGPSLWNNKNKSCLNKRKSFDASRNHKSSICWKSHVKVRNSHPLQVWTQLNKPFYKLGIIFHRTLSNVLKQSPRAVESKLYIPSTLNTDYRLWHTQLIVYTVKY